MRQFIVVYLIVLHFYYHNSFSISAQLIPDLSTNQQQHCGPPTDLEKLPRFAQEEIKSIWRQYVPGTKCEKEHEVTNDILTVMEMFEREFRGKLGLNAAESTVLTHQTPAAVVGSKKAGLSIKVRPAAISITRDSDATTTNSNNLLENNSFDGGILPSSSTKHTAEQQQRKPAAAKSIITNEQRHSNAFVVNIPVSSRRNSEYEDHTATAVVLESMEEPAEKQPISSRRPWAKSKRIQPPVGSRIQPARIQRKQEARVSQPQQQTAADKPIRLNKLPKPRDYDYNPRAGDISEELNKQFDDYDGSESPKGSKLVDRFPFLKGTSPDVATVFREALEDDDTPSEPRRQEELHFLAVSYLNAKQLDIFNSWSTQQRKKLLREEAYQRRHAG